MQSNRFPLIMIGVISFTIAAIAMMPARVAYRIFSPAKSNIQLHQIKGTIWSGQANRLYAMKHSFSNIQWQLQPLDLLLGAMTLDLQINDSNYPLKGTISRGFGGTLQANNLKATLPASLIQQAPYASFLGLSGTLRLDIPKLAANEDELKSVEGNVRLINGQISAPLQGNIGNLNFQLSTNQNGVLIKITDQQAPIGINGTVRLKPQKKFNFNASFTPRANADAFLVTMLKNAGQPQTDGSLLIKYDGRY